ncbi:rust resistance kinase Lr10-like [Humulus lupulus]|uniref:rust resistance kinase Lr10-like n=1 Tax=Humulus lupulus TaxID=3486 RepID=UPI002B408231|nr:rust resistance kinase Lr10-like [Humulus lupulus]
MPLRFLIHIFFFLFITCRAQNNQCSHSSCGKIQNISYPFWLKSDPNKCGDQRFVLSCENNVTILNLYSGKYSVEAINYINHTIRVVDPGLQKGNCSSLPRYPLSRYNFRSGDPYELVQWSQDWALQYMSKTVVFVSCEKTVKSHYYIDTASCSTGSKRHSYVIVNGSLSVSDMDESCGVELTTLVSVQRNSNSNASSFMDIHNDMAFGFKLSWIRGTTPLQIRMRLWHKIWDDFWTYRYLILFIFGAVIVGRAILGTPCLCIFLTYKWRRRHLSMYDRIEEFLQSYNNLVPIRYSYSEIKKMSQGFKDKLGEGGYGSVYKGKLRSGHLVAIKMLDTSKGNGEDFVNEVATIGRIHHVNVVRLIGFCVEGSKRALVYDFMTNGSLDKHIFSKEGMDSLSCKKIFEISLGVARGIEYLHQGCEMQILHFDIKPHNILLDDNFVTKVSDFGLARLCPLDNNTVSLTAARGTLGYIAPELFYKNLGGVSYKADVYSFGMLLMEMASRRRNVSSAAENSSQVHFPSWASTQFSEGNDFDFGVGTVEESKIIKKMMIVALWCIQFKPSDRPSMTKVVEMLEEQTESLEMPPTKFTFYSNEAPVEDLGEYSSSSIWSSTQSGDNYSDTSLSQVSD